MSDVLTEETLSVHGAGKSFSSVKVLDDVGFACAAARSAP